MGIASGGANTRASQESANYRSAGEDGKSCASCESFVPPDQCRLVAGTINAAGVSDLWSRKQDESAVAEMLFGGAGAEGGSELDVG